MIKMARCDSFFIIHTSPIIRSLVHASLALPQSIPERVEQLNPNAFVDALYVRRRHLCQPNRESVLLTLSEKSHTSILIDVIVKDSPWGCQTRTHDVRSPQHKFDRSSVHPQLRHHRWVFVQDVKRREVRSVSDIRKHDLVVMVDDQVEIVLTFCERELLLFREERLENLILFEVWVLVRDLGPNPARDARLGEVLAADAVGRKLLKHRGWRFQRERQR
mmetsp:Transcript_18660/g.60849  ORF Transcript_18660/g.60849 Transcript_18660/m.60849 type:complete len:219 (+) Transcript_18660:737-1393(+)